MIGISNLFMRAKKGQNLGRSRFLPDVGANDHRWHLEFFDGSFGFLSRRFGIL